ncbi:MAG: DsbA family oxidoreductase [Pseudomonadota bacterium]
MSEAFPNQITGNTDVTPPATLNVELVGDVICPFCYLGKRRLDEATRFVHGPITVGWYPFQLNPTMPPEGESFESYLAQRFGSQGAIQPVLDRLRSEGRDVGIDFRFDRLTHVPNTLPVHQVIQLAESRGMDVMPIVETFMAAYLTDGLDIGDADVIASLVAHHGLDRDSVVHTVADDAARDEVLVREETIRDSGISGVPGFLMNRRLLLVGAQEISGIVQGFDRAMFGDADGKPVEAPLH